MIFLTPKCNGTLIDWLAFGLSSPPPLRKQSGFLEGMLYHLVGRAIFFPNYVCRSVTKNYG
jgi:hypothetical protein